MDHPANTTSKAVTGVVLGSSVDYQDNITWHKLTIHLVSQADATKKNMWYHGLRFIHHCN